MAIFNQQSSAKKDVPSFANNDAAPNPQAAQTPTPIRETPAAADFSPTQAAPPPAAAEAPAKESLIAADLTIEGTIEGARPRPERRRVVTDRVRHCQLRRAGT